MSENEILGNFQQQLHVTLSHLYDYNFLFDHAFVAQVIPDKTGADRVQHFRERIIRAVEQLRPEPHIAFHAKDARTYNILNLHYIDQQDIEEVMERLALSRRQYFREQARALELLSKIFLQQLDHQKDDERTAPQKIGTITLASEIASLRQTNPHVRMNLGELVAGVVEAMTRLSMQYDVHIVIDETLKQVELSIDRTMLRQALLSTFSLLITNLTPGTQVMWSHSTSEVAVTVNMSFSTTQEQVEVLRSKLNDAESLRTVLQSIRLSLELVGLDDGSVTLKMIIPLKPFNVLVIDDNPDVIDLFRRYLTHQPYSLIAVQDAKTGVQIARETQPLAIILDLMLPNQDGYETLQSLKSHPETSRIPVLICSVLDAAELALSLGADDYLKKPPGQQELLSILSGWLG